jgi:hypothetical protein
MYNPDFYEEEISELNDEKINTIFGTIGVEPAVPKKGRIKTISESAKTELLKNAVIDCPKQWRQEYAKLIVDYHDVISKDSFDLGWTDVISHKIHMRDQVPSHSRQFRVPFERERTQVHRQIVEEGCHRGFEVALQFGHFLHGEEGAAGRGPEGAEATKMCTRL